MDICRLGSANPPEAPSALGFVPGTLFLVHPIYRSPPRLPSPPVGISLNPLATALQESLPEQVHKR